jgi:predicted ATPase/uncharacterized protein HemY
MGVGSGGHVLLSRKTAGLVADLRGEGVSLRELPGEYWLKDFPEPVGLFQALIHGVPQPPPPTPLTNIILPPTRFVGREQEICDIQRRVALTRLLTLLGPGGMGKTRLAFHVALTLLGRYPAGVWLVELSQLPAHSEVHAVAQEILRVLEVKEEPGRALTDTLIDFLRPRHVLLVLDNCEHVVAACADLVKSLLRACPDLNVLATSRERLRIPGETAWKVPRLSLPDPRETPPHDATPADRLMRYEAVQLFVDRALASDESFALTDENADAVVHLCQQLDGMPLAIELAAARVNVLTVQKMVERLHDRFRIFVAKDRTEEIRRKTLRALIDWSYDLLPEAERRLLQRLSVFAGGFTWEAASAICAGDEVPDDEIEVLDLLGHLVDKSLVDADQQGADQRYRLLQTIQQYARDRLRESNQEAHFRTRHRDWYLQQAEQAQRGLLGATPKEWFDYLETEHDNLRAALAWSLEQEDAPASLRLGWAIYQFWATRGYVAEGREHLDRILALPGAAGETVERARALYAAGLLARWQGDYGAATSLWQASLYISLSLEDRSGTAGSLQQLGWVAVQQDDYESAQLLYTESLIVHRALGDRHGMAGSLNALGVLADLREEYDAAQRIFEESLAISQALGFQSAAADSLHHLAGVAYMQGDYAAARRRCGEALARWQPMGNKRGIAMALNTLGNIAVEEGDYATAQQRLEESLDLFRELGDRSNVPGLLYNLGEVALLRGAEGQAAAHCREGLKLYAEQRNRHGIAGCLKVLGKVAIRAGQWDRAARLLSASAATESGSGSVAPDASADLGEQVATLRARLGEDAFATEWARGQELMLDQAVAEALLPVGAF